MVTQVNGIASVKWNLQYYSRSRVAAPSRYWLMMRENLVWARNTGQWIRNSYDQHSWETWKVGDEDGEKSTYMLGQPELGFVQMRLTRPVDSRRLELHCSAASYNIGKRQIRRVNLDVGWEERKHRVWQRRGSEDALWNRAVRLNLMES